MKSGWAIAIGAGLLLAMLQGCTEPSQAPENSTRQTVAGNTLPPRPEPTKKGEAPAELSLETMSEKDFLSKFRYRAKPLDYFIGTDFEGEIDPQLYHFQRVEVALPDGAKTEIRMQYFGAWAIWKNAEGNWEMLTTMTNQQGIIMHFHTLDPQFVSLGNFEIARRTVDGEAVTIRRGKFKNDDTYEYTVATRNRGVLSDTVNGLMVVTASGKHKLISETSAK